MRRFVPAACCAASCWSWDSTACSRLRLLASFAASCACAAERAALASASRSFSWPSRCAISAFSARMACCWLWIASRAEEWLPSSDCIADALLSNMEKSRLSSSFAERRLSVMACSAAESRCTWLSSRLWICSRACWFCSLPCSSVARSPFSTEVISCLSESSSDCA